MQHGPPLLQPSPPLLPRFTRRGRDLQNFFRAQGKRKGLWNSFCLTAPSLGWAAGRPREGERKICTVTMGRGEGRGHIRMPSHLLSPPDGLTRQNRGCSSALFITFYTFHQSEATCSGRGRSGELLSRADLELRPQSKTPCVAEHGRVSSGQTRAAVQFAQIFARFVLNRKSRERRWVPSGKHLSGGPAPCYLSGVMRFGMCACVRVCVRECASEGCKEVITWLNPPSSEEHV